MAGPTPKRSFADFSESLPSPSTGAHSSRRPRPTPHLWGSELWDMIITLPPDTTNAILFNACQNDPVASAAIQAAHAERLREIADAPMVDFSEYSRRCWHILNRQYKGVSGSRLYDAISDIESALGDVREEILGLAGSGTRWETRRNALECLRRCAKSVMVCEEGVVRRELMKDSVVLDGWAEAMGEVSGAMSEVERGWYRREGLFGKLEELRAFCEVEVEMPGLEEVFAVFNGEGGEEEEEEEEEEEDADGEAEEDDVPSDLPPSFVRRDEPQTRDHFPPPPVPPHTVDLPRRTSVFSISDML